MGQAIIGKEARQQYMDMNDGALPDAVVACVGGGSNAIGMFHPFTQDKEVAIYGAEADGDSTQGSATLARGSPGVLHGTRTYLLQDEETGQVQATHSISAGLDYPGVGPEHAFLKDSGRASYEPINNDDVVVNLCGRGDKDMITVAKALNVDLNDYTPTD